MVMEISFIYYGYSIQENQDKNVPLPRIRLGHTHGGIRKYFANNQYFRDIICVMFSRLFFILLQILFN